MFKNGPSVFGSQRSTAFAIPCLTELLSVELHERFSDSSTSERRHTPDTRQTSNFLSPKTDEFGWSQCKHEIVKIIFRFPQCSHPFNSSYCFMHYCQLLKTHML